MPPTSSPGEQKFIVPDPDTEQAADASLSMVPAREERERPSGFGDLQENRTARGRVRQYAGDPMSGAR